VFCNNIGIYSVNNTTYIGININIENYGDMFRVTEPSSGHIQNTVLVHSVCFVFGLMMVQ